jgi:ubiquitin-protein ligase E3 C
LEALIPQQWLSMFNDKELQALVSGVENRGLDLLDMQRHVQYAGGYDATHPVIEAFWEALASFTPGQQADFLRFVTSCPRPPLLGFAALEPALSIQMAGGGEGRGQDRLPTAATCVNLLKLPPYSGGRAEMREKLLYAVQSGAGFELS